MADFTLPALQYLMLFVYPAAQLSIPILTLVASVLAIHRASTWVATCLVGGAGLRLLSSLPSAFYVVVLHDHIGAPQYRATVMVTSVIGYVGGGVFVAGLFGLILGKPAKA